MLYYHSLKGTTGNRTFHPFYKCGVIIEISSTIPLKTHNNKVTKLTTLKFTNFFCGDMAVKKKHYLFMIKIKIEDDNHCKPLFRSAYQLKEAKPKDQK